MCRVANADLEKIHSLENIADKIKNLSNLNHNFDQLREKALNFIALPNDNLYSNDLLIRDFKRKRSNIYKKYKYIQGKIHETNDILFEKLVALKKAEQDRIHKQRQDELDEESKRLDKKRKRMKTNQQQNTSVDLTLQEELTRQQAELKAEAEKIEEQLKALNKEREEEEKQRKEEEKGLKNDGSTESNNNSIYIMAPVVVFLLILSYVVYKAIKRKKSHQKKS
ncbi:MAG: hypothetical protein AAF335_02260 [Bacteroidota bacterium]